MKRYMNMPDTRPLDVWGNPIGKDYKEKKWSELTPDEMKADFEWKSDILASFGEEVSGATFYQDYLFHQLYNDQLYYDYKILLTEYDAEKGSKVHKIDVDDIEGYLHLDDVALSPCLFYSNWRRKSLLNYVSAFVLDVDKLRPQNLQRFFMLFEKNRLLTPTFIANSGSGVHFYYVLDRMLRVDSLENEANNLIAEEIYKKLYDEVIKKEKWKDAQRHWLGQDYRVVNSKTKFQQTSQIFKVGEVFTIEQLMKYFGIKERYDKKIATKPMIKYATSIAKDLGLALPDFASQYETSNFIRDNKDAAYEVREQRRRQRQAKETKKKKNGQRKSGTWYKNTLFYMRDNTEAGYRFSSMRALAAIAHLESVPRDIFIRDIEELAMFWKNSDWHGDDFNARNVEAIIRYFDNAGNYKPSADKLEEWLGYSFKRIGIKRNGLSQKDHLEEARAIRDIRMRRQGKKWDENNGRKPKQEIVQQWQQEHPEGKKADCHRDTGLDPKTIRKWWK